MSAQTEAFQPPQRVARSTNDYGGVDSNKLGFQTVVDGEKVDVKVTAKRWKGIKNAAANSGVEPTDENVRTFTRLVSQPDKNESGNFYASVDAGDKNNPKAYPVEAAIAESMNQDGYANLLNDPNALDLVRAAIQSGALTAQNVSQETIEQIITGEAPAAGEPSAPAADIDADPTPDIPALTAAADAHTEDALAAARAELVQATAGAAPGVEAPAAPEPRSIDELFPRLEEMMAKYTRLDKYKEAIATGQMLDAFIQGTHRETEPSKFDDEQSMLDALSDPDNEIFKSINSMNDADKLVFKEAIARLKLKVAEKAAKASVPAEKPVPTPVPVVEAPAAPAAVDLPDANLPEGDEPSALQKELQAIYDALEAEVHASSPEESSAGLGHDEIGQLQSVLRKVEDGNFSLTEDELKLVAAGADNPSFSRLQQDQKAFIEQAFAEIKSKLPPAATEAPAPAPTETPQAVTEAVTHTPIEASLPKSRADLEAQAKEGASAQMRELILKNARVKESYEAIISNPKFAATQLIEMNQDDFIDQLRIAEIKPAEGQTLETQFAGVVEYASLQLETWRNEFVPDYFLKLGQELGLRNARIRLVEVPGILQRVPQIESLGASDARDTLNMVLQEITLSGAQYGFTTDRNGVMTMVSESARYYDIALDGSKGITPRETFEEDEVTLKRPDYLNRMIAGDLKTLDLTILKAAPKDSPIYKDAKHQVANQLLTPESKFGHSFVTALRVMAAKIDKDGKFENYGSKDIVKSRELMLKLSSAMATEGKFDFVGATSNQQAEFLAAFAGYLDAAMKDPKSQETTVDSASLLPGQEAKPYRDDFLESLNHDLDYLFVGWSGGAADGGFIDQMLRAGDEYGADFDEARTLDPEKSKYFYDRALKPYAKNGSLADYLGKMYEDAFEDVIAPFGKRNEQKVVDTRNAGRFLRATLMADDLSKTVDLLADSDFTPLADFLVNDAGKLSKDMKDDPSALIRALNVAQMKISNATDAESRTNSINHLKRLFAQTLNTLKRMKKEDAARLLSAYDSKNLRDGIASFMPEIPLSLLEMAYQKLKSSSN